MSRDRKSFTDDRLDDYKDVNARIVEFYQKYPDGRLCQYTAPHILKLPRWVDGADGKGQWIEQPFVVYTAAAYRSPDDKVPCIGTAWEPFPGRTPYTRDSELMNAETAAWGRAIVAAGIIAKNESIASKQEVRNRQVEHAESAPAEVIYENLDPNERVCPHCGKSSTLMRKGDDPEKAFCASSKGGCGKSFPAHKVLTRAEFNEIKRVLDVTAGRVIDDPELPLQVLGKEKA